MTEELERIKKQAEEIELNRRWVAEMQEQQRRLRELRAAELEPEPDVPDEELETRRYEPISQAEVQEIP